jgi:hypothetical protein
MDCTTGAGLAMDNTPFWQTGPFWACLPIGVAANACYYRLLSYLDNRRLSSQAKTRKRAEELFTIVSDIHFYRRDKFAYLLGFSTAIIVFLAWGLRR